MARTNLGQLEPSYNKLLTGRIIQIRAQTAPYMNVVTIYFTIHFEKTGINHISFYFRAKKLLPTIRKKQPSFVPDMNGFRMGYCK